MTKTRTKIGKATIIFDTKKGTFEKREVIQRFSKNQLKQYRAMKRRHKRRTPNNNMFRRITF
jgi:hypothetical protein